jgi:hypothetical protein
MNSNQSKLVDIHRWVDETLRTDGQANIIRAIEDRMKGETDEAVLRVLNFRLAGEFKSRGRYSEAERIYLMLFDQWPSEPAPLISLAEQKLYFEEEAVAARQIIDRALEVAFRSGNFRRQALGVKARILLKLGKYEDIEDIIRRLMNIAPAPGDVDVGIERDFFDRLPAGAIDAELARQFDRYSRAQS